VLVNKWGLFNISVLFVIDSFTYTCAYLLIFEDHLGLFHSYYDIWPFEKKIIKQTKSAW